MHASLSCHVLLFLILKPYTTLVRYEHKKGLLPLYEDHNWYYFLPREIAVARLPNSSTVQTDPAKYRPCSTLFHLVPRCSTFHIPHFLFLFPGKKGTRKTQGKGKGRVDRRIETRPTHDSYLFFSLLRAPLCSSFLSIRARSAYSSVELLPDQFFVYLLSTSEYFAKKAWSL